MTFLQDVTLSRISYKLDSKILRLLYYLTTIYQNIDYCNIDKNLYGKKDIGSVKTHSGRK